MRKSFRFGRHQLDVSVQEEGSHKDLRKELESVPDGEVIYSRTESWTLGATPSDEESRVGDDAGDAPIDVVSANPFRLRNLLLVPSAVLILVGIVGGRGSSLWWWLVLPGILGILAWEGLRRWERRL